MKCPKCVEEGTKSTLQGGAGSVTCVYYQPYYDEEGAYHNHDGNASRQTFSCSNGHRFTIKHGKKCPNCDWKIDEEITFHGATKLADVTGDHQYYLHCGSEGAKTVVGDK